MPERDYVCEEESIAAGPTLKEAIRRLGRDLSIAGVPTAALDARILAAEACGLTPARAIVEGARPLKQEESARLSAFATRRLSGEPVSRILGRREFFGLTFKLSPHTLDPRPETELLVETVLEHVRSNGQGNEPLRILDLGTGSGCIIAALLSELTNSTGVAIDKSEPALRTARQNFAALGLLGRCSLLCMDWASALTPESFDVVVGNPPYIGVEEFPMLDRAVSAFDPHSALDGGSGGLEAFRALVPQAARCLKPGGFIILETGRDQAAKVADLMAGCGSNPGFVRLRIITDLAGMTRAVAGLRQF